MKHRSQIWYGEQCLGHNQKEGQAQLQSNPGLAKIIEWDIRARMNS